MKIYWTCTYSKCTHKNEVTSHLVSEVPHIHNGKKYQLIPFKKEKKPTNNIKKLKVEVWDLFSEWVRRSASDEDGYCGCVSCGKIDHWKNMQAGHFIHGTSFLIPELVHPQCPHCNGFLHGNLIPYKEWMIKEYGQKTLDKLEYLAKQKHKYTVFELNQFKKLYQGKLRENYT
jgi:hypothetical protein